MSGRRYTTDDVTVAIVTYQREQVLVNTLAAVLEQGAGAILVVDQTPEHTLPVRAALDAWERDGRVRIERLARPSITRAMNVALRRAERELVLFLDDDVLPAPGLLAAHAAAYVDDDLWAVAGQVLQPGEEPRAATWDAVRHTGLRADLDFAFNSTAKTDLANAIACNLSVRRARALEAGGFDENFRAVAYRFETEFCRRIAGKGGRVLFEPAASLRHLQAPRGGTRAHGSHLTSASPAHGVGDYYFALRCGTLFEGLWYILRRPFRGVRTRFHLKHPWYIPVKWCGEALALVWALWLAAGGPAYVDSARRVA